jgi:hypothetical protein
MMDKKDWIWWCACVAVGLVGLACSSITPYKGPSRCSPWVEVEERQVPYQRPGGMWSWRTQPVLRVHNPLRFAVRAEVDCGKWSRQFDLPASSTDTRFLDADERHCFVQEWQTVGPR